MSWYDEETLKNIIRLFQNNEIKCKKIHTKARLPEKAGPEEACYDFFCVPDNDFRLCRKENRLSYQLHPQQMHTFHTGICLSLPKQMSMHLWDRSGMAAKRSLHRLAGMIDPTYTGEILVCLINLGHETQIIYEGDKIVQGYIGYVFDNKIVEVEELEKKIGRGNKGFGSTGQ